MPYLVEWKHLHCPDSKKKHSLVPSKSQTWTQERRLLDLVSRMLGKRLLTKFPKASKVTIRCSTRRMIAQLLQPRRPKKFNRQKRSSSISCPRSIGNPRRHSFFDRTKMRFVSRSWQRKFCASRWWRMWLVRPSYQSKID